MISATGNTGRKPDGFTLIEIVMVLALMAVAASVVIVNFNAMVGRGDQMTTEDILTQAVREARFIAASERLNTDLRYDAEKAALVIIPQDSQPISYPLGAPFEPNGQARILFYTEATTHGLAPLPRKMEHSQAIDHVRFAPDRSATAFTAEIDLRQGTPERIIFDPFTGLIRQPQS